MKLFIAILVLAVVFWMGFMFGQSNQFKFDAQVQDMQDRGYLMSINGKCFADYPVIKGDRCYPKN